MSYRREKFTDFSYTSYAADSLHLLASKIGIVDETSEERIIRQYAQWRKQISSEISPEPGYANPDSFRDLVFQRVQTLQHSTDTPEAEFISKKVPFEKVSANPNGAGISLFFPTLSLDLLKRHPNQIFSSCNKQGIELIGPELWFTTFDNKGLLHRLSVPDNIIYPDHPTELRFIITAAAWALDPKRV